MVYNTKTTVGGGRARWVNAMCLRIKGVTVSGAGKGRCSPGKEYEKKWGARGRGGRSEKGAVNQWERDVGGDKIRVCGRTRLHGRKGRTGLPPDCLPVGPLVYSTVGAHLILGEWVLVMCGHDKFGIKS